MDHCQRGQGGLPRGGAFGLGFAGSLHTLQASARPSEREPSLSSSFPGNMPSRSFPFMELSGSLLLDSPSKQGSGWLTGKGGGLGVSRPAPVLAARVTLAKSHFLSAVPWGECERGVETCAPRILWDPTWQPCIVPSSPQPSRDGDLEVTQTAWPQVLCGVSALYTTLLIAPGLLSDPFLHFPHNSSCEQRSSRGPGAVLLFYTHGLVYFSQICKVCTTPVPFVHVIWWGLERLSHTPKATQLLSGRTKVPAQLHLLESFS